MPRASSLRNEESTLVAPDMGVPVLTGTHFHSLDDKGRIIVPAKLRAGLTERFWMMIDENNNIAMYNDATGRDVLEYCEQQMAQNPGDEFIAQAVERITGAAELIVMEGDAWRVPVSEILRFRASIIEREVVTVGVLNKAVMWSRPLWEQAQLEAESPEVKKAQATMLRAAASRSKKKEEETEKIERIERVEEADGTNGTSRKTASASDGGRSSRILTLSQLGR